MEFRHRNEITPSFQYCFAPLKLFWISQPLAQLLNRLEFQTIDSMEFQPEDITVDKKEIISNRFFKPPLTAGFDTDENKICG